MTTGGRTQGAFPVAALMDALGPPSGESFGPHKVKQRETVGKRFLSSLLHSWKRRDPSEGMSSRARSLLRACSEGLLPLGGAMGRGRPGTGRVGRGGRQGAPGAGRGPSVRGESLGQLLGQRKAANGTVRPERTAPGQWTAPGHRHSISTG